MTKENIEFHPNQKENKDYLQALLLKIKKCHENDEIINFRITEKKEKGFVVKTNGLFAYVSYHHFAWSYPTLEFWENASNYLIGSYFRGKIYSISENPISIHIDACVHSIKKLNLEKSTEYQAIILLKTKYGVFVDLGFHFNWELGSIFGLIHISTFKNELDFYNLNVGEKITTYFHGYNEKGKIILGDNFVRGKWVNEEMMDLIGTIQVTTVRKGENKKLEFYVLDKFKASIPISKEFYPKSKPVVKEILKKLKDQDILFCEVIRINRKKGGFTLKLLNV
jgi:ribosomal protein S1